MENAIKAMYIAAGMLLAVMILGVWVYLFRQGASLGQNYEADKITLQIQAFNSQFEKYTVVTNQRGANDGFSFEEKGNIPSDVITCANLAYNINSKNEYDATNCVEVSVVVGSKKYYIHSAEFQPENYFLINTSKASARRRTRPYNTSDSTKCKSFYDFLREYNNVKIVNVYDPTKVPNDYSSYAETIYEYYFDVKPEGIHYNENTGKVDELVFTAVKTNGFDNLASGLWSENI